MLLPPWAEVRDDLVLAEELTREVPEGHVLFGRALRAVARRIDCDDVLFVGDGVVAVVHLTWKRSREIDPRWPTTEVFASLDDFATGRMRRDHESYDA